MYRPQLGAGADGHALERAVRQHNELLRIKQALEADLWLSSLELEQRKAAAARSRHQPMKGKAAVTTAHRAGAVIHHLRDASEKLRGHMHELAIHKRRERGSGGVRACARVSSVKRSRRLLIALPSGLARRLRALGIALRQR